MSRVPLALCLIAASLTGPFAATPASAKEHVVGTFECFTTLKSFPGNDTGVCSGTLDNVVDSARAGVSFTARYNYGEPSTTRCLQGNANGVIDVEGEPFFALFSWTRVGATAVVTLNGRHTGVAVAAFEAASSALTTCAAGGSTANLPVHVTGAVAAASTP